MTSYDLDKILGTMPNPDLPEMPDNETMAVWMPHYEGLFTKIGYVRDSVNSQVYDSLMRYCCRWYGGKHGDCRKVEKGLLIRGKKGTGKTSFFKRFSAIFDIPFIKISEPCDIYGAAGEEDLQEYINDLRWKPIIIDDLGREREVSKYGNKAPIAQWLESRFEDYEDNGIYTFFTTNFSDEELSNFYGDWILSRLRGMCWFLTMPGNDRRLH